MTGSEDWPRSETLSCKGDFLAGVNGKLPEDCTYDGKANGEFGWVKP